MRLTRDTSILFAYAWRTAMANPFWIVLGAIQPVLWLVLFGPLLTNLGGPGVPRDQQLELFVPGVLMLLALFTPLFIGFELIADLKAGVLERLAATPANRIALLLGRVLRDVTGLVVQALVLLAVAVLMGLHLDLPGTAATLVLLALVGVTAATLSYGFALTLRDENAFASMLSSLSLPIMLLAGLLLPISLAPDWIQIIANVNPFYHGVEAARALMAGTFEDSSVPLGFAVLCTTAVLSIAWVVPKFRRVTA